MEAEAEGEDRDERRGRGQRGEAKGRAGKRSGEKVKQGRGQMGRADRATHHSAFLCDVLTICGKSITTGSPLSRRMRMLNSLKSPWMSPARAKRTMRSMSDEYSLPGDGRSSTCRLCRTSERYKKTQRAARTAGRRR